uniref:Agenet-like domain-containing protein n=1 Tax=Marmota marmota marmota TaxID=9994 RepID=A0A8C5Z874_MARMA
MVELTVEGCKYNRDFYKEFIKSIHEDSITVRYIQEQMTKNYVDGGWLKFR